MRSESTSRGILILTVANGLYTAIGYVLVVLLGRILDPEGFGEYGVAAGMITVVNMLVARGLPVAASKAIAAEPNRAPALLSTLTRLMVPFSLIVGAIVLALAWPLTKLLGDDDLLWPLAFAALSAPGFAVFGIAWAHANGTHHYPRQAYTQIMYAGSRLAAIAGGAKIAGLTGAVVGFFVAGIVGALPSLFRSHGERERREEDRTAMLAIMTPLMLTAAFSMLLMIVDVYAVKRVVTDHAAGVYVAAGTLAHVPFFLLQAAGIVLMPGMANAKDDEERRRFVSRGLSDTIVLLALPTAMLVAVGDRLITPVFGAEFASDAVIVAPLAVATAAVTLYSAFTALEAGIGQLKEATALGLIGVVGVATAVSIAGSDGNVERAAYAATIVCIALGVAHAALIRKRFGTLADPRCLIGIAFAIPFAWALRALPAELPPIAAAGLVFTIVYLGVLRYAKILTFGTK